MLGFANTPKAPYFVVIFTYIKTQEDNGYEEMANLMLELVNKQDGFLGFESAREDIDITVSYWKDEESIKKWKTNVEHLNAQTLGKELWYLKYKVRIAKVERDYEFSI